MGLPHSYASTLLASTSLQKLNLEKQIPSQFLPDYSFPFSLFLFPFSLHSSLLCNKGEIGILHIAWFHDPTALTALL
jgi:hypothetical protein